MDTAGPGAPGDGGKSPAAGMKNLNPAPITAVYTDIGRGHPNYLDSVLRYVRIHHPAYFQLIKIVSVFDLSRGLSLLGWKTIRRLYRSGSRGGPVSVLYSRLRSKKAAFNRNSAMMEILRRDILTHFRGYQGACLVAHPLLANMLKDRHRVWYVHGEIAAPPESAVRGVEKVYVPLDATRENMASRGVPAESLITTGLVLEPELRDGIDDMVDGRIQRIASRGPLTVGFFISGAYPRRHIDFMIRGAVSCFRAGMKVRLFWGCDSRYVKRLANALREFSRDLVIDNAADPVAAEARLVAVTADSREAETIRSTAYLPGLDLFCAAPHERVNWAVGAGLPIIMITPTIGTFAPGNRACVLETGSGIELSDAASFARLAELLTGMRESGRLADMVKAGRKIRSIDGAKTIADDLINSAL